MNFFLLTMFVCLLCIKNAKAQNPTYADIPGPENVLVVYNPRSQTSIAIKDYYKNARNIPSSNIVDLPGLDTLANITDPETGVEHLIKLRQGEGNEKEIIVDTDNSWCSTGDFLTKHAWIYFNERIAIPIAQHLASTIVNGKPLKDVIRFIVLCKGVPFKIWPRLNYQESCNQNVPVDALLCFLGETIDDPGALLNYFNDECPLQDPLPPCVGDYHINNPYYNVDPTFSMDHQFLPNHYSSYNSHFDRDIALSYLITHLDAPGLDDVKNMIDSSIAAINSSGYDWFIDSDPTPCEGGSQILHPSDTKIVFNNLGISNKFIDEFETIYTTHNKPVMSYSSNGIHTTFGTNPPFPEPCNLYFPEEYIQTELEFTYIAGSVFNTAESFNATTLGIDPIIDPSVRGGQGQLPEFFLTGGTVGVGQVNHGTNGGIIISNKILMPSYAMGYSFIEAAYLGMKNLTDNRVVVGDPLTRIYDCPEQILTGTLNSGTYSCRIIVPEGGVLTIPAGAIINFEKNGSLRVEGTLIVESNANVNFSSYSELRVLDTGVLTANAGVNINFSVKSIFNVSGIVNINDNTTITLNDNAEFNVNGMVNINDNCTITTNDNVICNIDNVLNVTGATLSLNDDSKLLVENTINFSNSIVNINSNSTFQNHKTFIANNSTFNFESTNKVLFYDGNGLLYIDGCSFSKGKLKITAATDNNTFTASITNSTFFDNAVALEISSRLFFDVIVNLTSNTFTNFSNQALNVAGVNTLNIINNNEFNGNASGSSTGILLQNNGNVIVDNNIINNTFTAIQNEERLLEIPELQEEQNITIENNIIENSGTGIQITDPSNHISSAELKSNTFTNCNGGIVLNNISNFSPGLKGNTITNSTNQGIAVTNVNEVTVQNNSIINSDLGINLSNVTNAHIIDNTITSGLNSMPGIFLESSNGELRGNTIIGHTNGIELGNSSPDIGDNTITDNLYHGIYIGSGSLPNMVGTLAGSPPLQYPTAGYNDIFDNGGWDDPNAPPDNDGSEIFISFANALMERGCNSIMDDRAPGGTLINTQYLNLMGGESFGMPIQVNAEYNYWSFNPLYPLLQDRFINLIVYFDPPYSQPCSVPQGASGGGSELFVTASNGAIIDTLYSIDSEIGELSTTELLYAVAEEKFLTADYENAEDIYNQIINSNDTLFAKLKAYQMLYNLGRLTHKSPDHFSDLKTVYSSLSLSAADSLLQKIFSQLVSLSLVGQTEYVSAIEEFDVVVQQNQGTEEAMYAEIDALTTALLLAPDSSLGKGSLGKYAVTDISDYTNRVSNLLKQRVGSNNYNKEPIPTEYALYQNYPNPFNPSTTIKYSIIKTIKVKLAVYDILGREVLVLADEVKEPGFYEVNFDASYLSSGVYFYRLVSGSFVSTRKMVLVK